jgi:hypothetical protein
MRRVATVLAVAAALALPVAGDCWAGKGGGGGGGHGGGGHGGHGGHGHGGHRSGGGGAAGAGATQPLGVAGFRQQHRGRALFLVEAPFVFWYAPYDYSRPQYNMPSTYVEKFDGTPTRETQGDIFCARESAYYPDVQDCPGGWQRIIRLEDS